MLCDVMYKSGEILRSTLLGTTATYRVMRDDGDGVLVEVIDAPGLPQGFQMRLTADAARALERVVDKSTSTCCGGFGPASGPIPDG